MRPQAAEAEHGSQEKGEAMVESDAGPVAIYSFVPARELTPEMEKWLFDGLAAALPSLNMRQLFDLRHSIFSEADLLTVAAEKDSGAAIGVLSSRWSALPSGQEFLHIQNQFVGERHQRGLTFGRSWGSHFAEIKRLGLTFPKLIVLKTYNPIAYCAMRAFARIPDVMIYPEVTVAEQHPKAIMLAEQIAKIIAVGYAFESETGVIRGIGIPANLYPALPMSANKDVNTYFAAVTQPGDRMLCMLQVPTERAAAAILSAFGISRHRERPAESPEGRGDE
jgi:hypothetical protein